MKIIQIFILIILIQIFGCIESNKSYTFNGKYYDLSTLYYQKIPNSSKILYKFSAWSKLNDSNVNGMIIFDSTEVIQISKINEELPFKYLTDLPNNQVIKGIKFLKPKKKFDIEEKEINQFSIKKEGIEIQVSEKEYYSGYSTVNCFLHEYQFEKVNEIGDSIFLKGISTKRKTLPKLEKGIKFRKGNILLDSDANGFITQITVNQIVEEKGNLYRYKYGSKELEELIEDKFVLCVRTYFFKPTIQISENKLSDIGIFKRKNEY